MDPQAIVDAIEPVLTAKGWRDVSQAESLEPDFEQGEVPAARVFRGPNKPRGDSDCDNFIAQTVQEFIGIFVIVPRDELDVRIRELSDAVLGRSLPAAADFAIQYQEGKPLDLSRDKARWLEVYFTEKQRRQAD